MEQWISHRINEKFTKAGDIIIFITIKKIKSPNLVTQNNLSGKKFQVRKRE